MSVKKKVIIIVFILLIALASTIFYYFNPVIKSTSFEVTPSLFKVVLDQEEMIKANIEIKNFDDKTNFTLKTGNLDGIVFIEEHSFIVEKGNSKIINVNVSGLNSIIGTHVGHISLSNGVEEKIIPFVVSIHTPTQFFAINLDVDPDKKQLTKKEDLETDIKFFNLYDDESHTLDLTYNIIDINGKTLFSESEKITVGVRSSFTKKFALPKNIPLGDYVFVISLDYLGTITTSSYLFAVVDKKPISFFNINILAWIVIIFAGITFLLVLYLIYEKTTLSSQLKKQQDAQVKCVSEKISEEKKRRLTNAKTQKEKKKIIDELQDAKIKILDELKKQQRHQKHELKGLQKKKNIKAKKRKLHQWKKESYSKAIKSAEISSKLKNKLDTLKDAYEEGFIKKKSYNEGVSKIKHANKKIKRNIYK